ncbi:MAG TPA: VOC family protein [Steroidobacteraceae bacterium]|jgi:catechol 2,3-dioxygenase-like lactoylglutathione lyase family enzyme
MAETNGRRTFLGVHSIDHFSLLVPDVDKARHFFTHFGLDIRDVARGIDLYTFGNDHRWAAIREGKQKRLQHVSLLAFPDDIERFRGHFKKHGIETIAAPVGASVDSGGVWIATPDGLAIHIAPGAKNSPNERDPVIPTPRHSIERGAPVRGTTPPTRPKRLAHVLLFTEHLDRAIEFFGKALGLRLSDRSGGVAFMHGGHGSDHHLIALAQSNGYGMHHSAWTVQSIDEIGLGSERMIQVGYSRGWGIGRHVLGSNYFRYIRDPWGSYAEYSFDIDFVPAAPQWEVWSPPPENSLYIWGPEVPEDFIHNYEAACD